MIYANSGKTEACDDGNTANGDGCTSTCLAIEPGWDCTTPAFGLSVCTGKCDPTNPYVVGTNGLGVPYQCSDNDADPGDGCDSTCMIEPGWVCTTTVG